MTPHVTRLVKVKCLVDCEKTHLRITEEREREREDTSLRLLEFGQMDTDRPYWPVCLTARFYSSFVFVLFVYEKLLV